MGQILTVKIPATTANMGSGFDCLGMALEMWNTVRVELGGDGLRVFGQGEKELSSGPTNLVYRSFEAPFEEAGLTPPRVGITCINEIPLKRGLGSSSAAVVGGLVAGNELAGRPLSPARLLEMAAEVEGHADNVAPALLGGCQIVVRHGDSFATARVPVPAGLRAVVFIPDVAMATSEAREVLPSSVKRSDAVYNMGRIALLVASMFTGELEHLAIATEDRLHQRARQPLFPAMTNIFRAALSAGASAVFLSGAGSTVLALAREKEMTIGYEMADAAMKSGIDGTLKIVEPSSRGSHVVE